jgi:hypothetical protein
LVTRLALHLDGRARFVLSWRVWGWRKWRECRVVRNFVDRCWLVSVMEDEGVTGGVDKAD